MLVAALPLVSEELGLGYAQVGLLLALPQLGSALAEPLIGLAADAAPRRALVGGGGIAFAAGLVGVAAAWGFVPLLAALVVVYPASGAFVSVAQACLMDADAEERERNMLRWTVAGGAGSLLGPLAVAGAAALALGWRPLFLVLAALSLALAVRAGRTRLGGGIREEGVRGAARALAAALRRREVLRRLLALEASDLLLDVFVGFLALLLVDEAGLSPAGAALVVGAWLAAGLAGSAALVPLVGRVGGARYVRLSAPVAAALLCAFLLLPGVAAKTALVVALGLVTAGWYPVLKARLYAELPGRSGVALALGGLTAPVSALPPLAVGALASVVGLGGALWLLLLAPAALLALVPREEASPPA